MQLLQIQIFIVIFIFILASLPKSNSTSVPGRRQGNTKSVQTLTSTNKTVRKITRARGRVSEKTTKFKRRRNRKRREKQKRILSKLFVKDTPLVGRIKYTRTINNVNKVGRPQHDKNKKRKTHDTSKKKSILRRKPTKLATSTLTSHIDITNMKTNAINNYTEVLYPKSSAEANYLALRRNVRIKQQQLTTISPTTKAPNIKNMIDNMIDQLKSDLNNLFKFDENLLHFDKSIVKNAAKKKVEYFFENLSTAINTRVSRDCVKNKFDYLDAATNILNVTEDISNKLASTLDIGSKTEIKLANISMTVMKKRLSENTSSEWDSGAVKVNLPDQSNIAQDDSSVTVSFTSYNNLGSLMNADDDIRSPVLSVNVLKHHNQNQKRSIPLTKPIEFAFHHKPFKKIRKRKCTYWDFKYAAWSTDGCYTLRKKSTATSTACQCFHLTNFVLTVEEGDEDEDIEITTETTIVDSSLLKFGDKLFPEVVTKETSVSDALLSEFVVYGVTAGSTTESYAAETTENQQNISPYVVQNDFIKIKQLSHGLPFLNSRDISINDYGHVWEDFEERENNIFLVELPVSVGRFRNYEPKRIQKK